MSAEHPTPGPDLLDGRYRLDGLLGSGGMGEVHRAWDTRLGRRVAIKRLPAELVANPEVVARLRAEGRLLAAIAHPNLVTLYDVSDDPASAHLVMELVEGESLAARLCRDGPLPVREVAAIVTGVAAGLSALHGAGIIHRDVSPGNVLLGMDGRARLADLGLARDLGAEAAPEASDGVVHGTFRYLAPELLDGAPATTASDVYGLAAVAYAALLGRPPAVATDLIKLRAAHREPPIRPSLLRPGLDPALDQILLTALGPAPARPSAYGFAVGVAAALRACDDPRPSATVPTTIVPGVAGVSHRTAPRRSAMGPMRRVAAALVAGTLVLGLGSTSLVAIDQVLTRPAGPDLVAEAALSGTGAARTDAGTDAATDAATVPETDVATAALVLEDRDGAERAGAPELEDRDGAEVSTAPVLEDRDGAERVGADSTVTVGQRVSPVHRLGVAPDGTPAPTTANGSRDPLVDTPPPAHRPAAHRTTGGPVKQVDRSGRGTGSGASDGSGGEGGDGGEHRGDPGDRSGRGGRDDDDEGDEDGEDDDASADARTADTQDDNTVATG